MASRSLLTTWCSTALVVLGALLSACASAGGTAGIFDSGSVWYKHPTTGDVKECGGGEGRRPLRYRRGDPRSGGARVIWAAHERIAVRRA